MRHGRVDGVRAAVERGSVRSRARLYGLECRDRLALHAPILPCTLPVQIMRRGNMLLVDATEYWINSAFLRYRSDPLLGLLEEVRKHTPQAFREHAM